MLISAITEKGGKVEFIRNEVMMSKNEYTIFREKRNNRVICCNENLERAMSVENNSLVKLWHKRLEHLGMDNMTKLLKLFQGIKLMQDDKGGETNLRNMHVSKTNKDTIWR